MSREIEDLLLQAQKLFFLSVPATLFLWAVHRDSIAVLRFERLGPREPPLWGVADFVVIFVAFVLSQLGVGILLPSFHGNMGEFVFLSALVSGGVVYVLVYKLVRVSLGQPYSTLGLAPLSIRSLVTGLLVFLAALFPICLAGTLWQLFLHAAFGWRTQLQDVVQSFQHLVQTGETRSAVLFIVAGSLLAPLTEEMLFRGVFFGALRAKRGPLFGALASSFVFALVHQDLGTFVTLWLLGCALAYVYYRTGSLYGSMACHALFNSLTFSVVLQTRGKL